MSLAGNLIVAIHDRALQLITQHCLSKYKLSTALRAAEMIVGPTHKAIGMLNVAVAYARQCDHQTARNIASRIELTNRDRVPPIGAPPTEFDYRLPHTWGSMYVCGFTGASRRYFQNQAAQIADASMMLAQLLGQRPPHSYAAEFKDVRQDVVIRALGRAHAGTGDPNAALAWAYQIGLYDTRYSTRTDDAKIHWEQRIHALTGVAEGILDRTISRE